MTKPNMLCKIADLLVEISAAGGMDTRCRDYLIESNEVPDIVIRSEKYNFGLLPGVPLELAIYLLSGGIFYTRLLRHNGLMLHSSAVEIDGKAYLFSGPCGMGKSTHTRFYKEVFGERACIFNDDKPALRKIDGIWYAYGTPWCGKDGINVNKKVPLAGICFLQRGEKDEIRRLSQIEAIAGVISQTVNAFHLKGGVDITMDVIEQLTADIPIYELHATPTRDSALVSYRAMSGENLGE